MILAIALVMVGCIVDNYLKLACMLLYEFLLVQQLTLLVIDLFQSQIRALIGANLIHKGLVLLNKQETSRM